jgi:pantetheine-phosphate adenylyltransferase
LTVAIYPGSFDPITNGHVDIATRASRIFDKVIIAVFAKPDKQLVFGIDERVELAQGAFANATNIEVKPYHVLTGEFARQVGAKVMVRGLRMSSDFEWEFELAMMNSKLFPEIETVCFMASQEFQFLSSSLMKEAARFGGNISTLVPKNVAEAVKKKGLILSPK